MAIKYSPEMKKKIDELNIKDEEILYMTITRDPLRRILDGSKKVEFRELSDWWLKKFNEYNKDLSFKEVKPIKYLLLQNGTDPGVPRVLIELKNQFHKYEADKTDPAMLIVPNLPKPERRFPIKKAKEKYPLIFEQAKIEGFEDDDEWLALELGNIIHSENLEVLNQSSKKTIKK